MSDKPYKIDKDVPYYIVAPFARFLGENQHHANSIYYPGIFEGDPFHIKVESQPEGYDIEFDEGGMRVWATYSQVSKKDEIRRDAIDQWRERAGKRPRNRD